MDLVQNDSGSSEERRCCGDTEDHRSNKGDRA